METKKNNEGITVREIIKKVVHANKTGLNPEELKAQEKAMIKIFEKGMIPGKALGFSAEFLEYVYKFAYSLYQQNKIEEAAQLYLWLKTMVPFNETYTIALINCRIHQKKWIQAVSYLMELTYLHPKDPFPFEKICDCLMEEGDLRGALIAIHEAIERAGNKKEYAQNKARWLMNYDFILSQINSDADLPEKGADEKEGNKNLNIASKE